MEEGMTIALIFAGGSGTRMNSRARPKQFLQFYGKELIIHTMENFQNHPEVNAAVVVCIADWIPYLYRLLEKYQIDKVREVVPGGASGQESIYSGLLAAREAAGDDAVVLVHDGVRPFVGERLISECIRSVRERGSAITVTPAIETIVTTEGGRITSITDRSKCYHAKAPQSVRSARSL